MRGTEKLETLPDPLRVTLGRYMREEPDRFGEKLDRAEKQVSLYHFISSGAQRGVTRSLTFKI
jgi:hypothetical protein